MAKSARRTGRAALLSETPAPTTTQSTQELLSLGSSPLPLCALLPAARPRLPAAGLSSRGLERRPRRPPPGSRSGKMGKGGMQNFDFFRKVPRDFTEGTAPGSALSIVATIVMTSLFFLELKNYLTVKIVTDIVMDPGSRNSNDLAINFDMTMPELVCQFASMDVSDMMGTERQGITKDIKMMRQDGQGKDIGELDYGANDNLTYESVDDEEKELPCTVTMYEHGDFTGWEAVFGPRTTPPTLLPPPPPDPARAMWSLGRCSCCCLRPQQCSLRRGCSAGLLGLVQAARLAARLVNFQPIRWVRGLISMLAPLFRAG